MFPARQSRNRISSKDAVPFGTFQPHPRAGGDRAGVRWWMRSGSAVSDTRLEPIVAGGIGTVDSDLVILEFGCPNNRPWRMSPIVVWKTECEQCCGAEDCEKCCRMNSWTKPPAYHKASTAGNTAAPNNPWVVMILFISRARRFARHFNKSFSLNFLDGGAFVAGAFVFAGLSNRPPRPRRRFCVVFVLGAFVVVPV
jgi:hypothetical protein